MQKKILKKELNLAFAIAVFIIAGIAIWQISGNSSNFQNQNIAFSYVIKGCAETDQGTTTKSLGHGEEQEPKIEVQGNNVIYSRATNHLCCRKAVFEKEITGNTINIYEVWSGIGCKCICFSSLKAEVKNLSPGEYTVNVYEKGTLPGNENLPMNQTSIVSKKIVIE